MDSRRAQTTFIQRLPGARTHYRGYLPLMPLASSSSTLRHTTWSCPARTRSPRASSPGRTSCTSPTCTRRCAMPGTCSTSTCASRSSRPGIRSWLARWLLHRVRLWDLRTANGVDHFVANSHFIRRRVEKVYRRDAAVVHPPVDVDAFDVHAAKDDYFMTASRLVPYKRVELIVEAFARMPDKRLVVVGDGPEFARIRAPLHAEHHDVRLSAARGAAHPHAARPRFRVRRRGGLRHRRRRGAGMRHAGHRVRPRRQSRDGTGQRRCTTTGVFFKEQNADALCSAVRAFDAGPAIDPARLPGARRALRHATISRSLRTHRDAALGRVLSARNAAPTIAPLRAASPPSQGSSPIHRRCRSLLIVPGYGECDRGRPVAKCAERSRSRPQ